LPIRETPRLHTTTGERLYIQKCYAISPDPSLNYNIHLLTNTTISIPGFKR